MEGVLDDKLDGTGSPAAVTGIARRRIALGAAWAIPTVTVAALAPQAAASPPVAVLIATAGLSSGGIDLNLRDTKATNSNTNTSPTTITVVNLTLTVVDYAGNPVAGATVSVAGELAHHPQPATAGHRTRARHEISDDDPQQRGLARTVGTHQRDLGPIADPKVHLRQENPPVRQLVAHSRNIDMAHE